MNITLQYRKGLQCRGSDPGDRFKRFNSATPLAGRITIEKSVFDERLSAESQPARCRLQLTTKRSYIISLSETGYLKLSVPFLNSNAA